MNPKRAVLLLVAVSFAAGCVCSDETGVQLRWQPLSRYCGRTGCRTLAEATASVQDDARKSPGGHCNPGLYVVTTCDDGHSTVTQFLGMGWNVEHFSADGKMIGANAMGGVRYGSRPDCTPKTVTDYCVTSP